MDGTLSRASLNCIFWEQAEYVADDVIVESSGFLHSWRAPGPNVDPARDRSTSLIFSSTDRIDTGIAPVDVWAGFRWTYIAGPFKAPELGMSVPICRTVHVICSISHVFGVRGSLDLGI